MFDSVSVVPDDPRFDCRAASRIPQSEPSSISPISAAPTINDLFTTATPTIRMDVSHHSNLDRLEKELNLWPLDFQALNRP